MLEVIGGDGEVMDRSERRWMLVLEREQSVKAVEAGRPLELDGPTVLASVDGQVVTGLGPEIGESGLAQDCRPVPVRQSGRDEHVAPVHRRLAERRTHLSNV